MLLVGVLYLFAWFRTAYANAGVSGSGTTSQNWNCCKPSCAWPGKANVSAPVRSCDIKNQALLDATIESSCQDGDSYMCADQAPWVDSPNLAYGFAAVKIVGGSETSWCCACYELRFTSGSANGKRMIVQAADTVYDTTTTNSQFVLAVPGAKFSTPISYSNSCVAQYGPGGWDSGLSSGSKCDNLPLALQTACEWRSAWFGAEYPSVNFTQIKCPVELTNKTGCTRADENELFKYNSSGLAKAPRILLGVAVPVGLILGALTAYGVFVKLRNRRSTAQQHSPSKRKIEKSDIGIIKVYEQHYFELDSSPVTDKKWADKMDKHQSRSPGDKLLPDLKSLPSPNPGIRHPAFDKVKQELEGSPTSELGGDATIEEALGKQPRHR